MFEPEVKVQVLKNAYSQAFAAAETPARLLFSTMEHSQTKLTWTFNSRFRDGPGEQPRSTPPSQHVAASVPGHPAEPVSVR